MHRIEKRYVSAHLALYRSWTPTCVTLKHFDIAFDLVPGNLGPLQDNAQLNVRTTASKPQPHILMKLSAALAPSGFHDYCRHLGIDRYDALVWLFC
jgi:hypothetical protein